MSHKQKRFLRMCICELHYWHSLPINIVCVCVCVCVCVRCVRWTCRSSSRPMRWSTTSCRMSCWTRPRLSTSTSELRSWRGPIRASDSRTSTCWRSCRYTHIHTYTHTHIHTYTHTHIHTYTHTHMHHVWTQVLDSIVSPILTLGSLVFHQVSHAHVRSLESRVEECVQSEVRLTEQVSALEEEKKQLLSTVTHLQDLLTSLGIQSSLDGHAPPPAAERQAASAATTNQTVESLLHLSALPDSSWLQKIKCPNSKVNERRGWLWRKQEEEVEGHVEMSCASVLLQAPECF